MKDKEAAKIGRLARDYGNPMIQCFAAERIGESYPLSAEMVEILLKDLSDVELGQAIVAWGEAKEEATP